jgi:hypothetical protein
LTTKPNIYSTVSTFAAPGGTAVQANARFLSIRQWLAGSSSAPSLDGFQALTNALTTEWQEAFSLVDKAVALPYRGVLPGGEYSYRVAGLWNMLRLLSARTIGLAVAGDGDAAVSSAISSIKLRRAIRPSQRTGSVITHEVPAMLSLSKPSEDALIRLQKTLTDEEDADGPARDFLAVRAQLLDILWRNAYRVGPGELLPRPFPWELFPSPWMRPIYTHRIVNSLREWAELSDIARKPWPERAALAAEPMARYSAERPKRPLSGAGMPGMWFRQVMEPDTLIHDRCSRIAVAIERYRRAHEESLPAALTDLVPSYLTEIPEDPITGKPLLYLAAADAYIVYSVGPDGKDDGGMLRRQADPKYKGPGTMFPPSVDRGIRVLVRK